MIYNVFIDVDKRNTAGLKAPADIAQISLDNGFQRFTIPKFPGGRSYLYSRAWLIKAITLYIWRMYWKLQEGDYIVLQNLNYGIKPLMKAIPVIRKKKKCKFIILIHDLESLRKGIAGIVENNQERSNLADKEFLDAFDWIISHNQHMTDYLVNHNGINPAKIVNLEIFDYLTDIDRIQPKKGDIPSVAIAGNLAKAKCGYVYELPGDPQAIHIHLYGNNYDETISTINTTYHGSFKPEELPNHLVGDFGLVWDGNSGETCDGNTGNYLRYNNPHKTSLYLASNMPVVVWKEAAIADFVLDNGVGITINNLNELGDAIRSVSPEEYDAMCDRVKEVSQKLRAGYYFTRAISRCVEAK